MIVGFVIYMKRGFITEKKRQLPPACKRRNVCACALLAISSKLTAAEGRATGGLWVSILGLLFLRT